MPSLRYTVLTLFQSSLGFLAEISRATDFGPKTCVNEWIWMEARRAVTLKPVTQAGHLAFEEGRVRLQDAMAELQWISGGTDMLVRVAPAALPSGARRLLESHLS